MAKYEIRLETYDGTLEDPCYRTNNKADAMRVARALAKGGDLVGVARVIIDAAATGLTLKFFQVAR